ncbi:MAG: acetate kinase [Sphingobacteriia bacterium]|nr:acetate kinase [Sphingobacteriia bacterium]NCC39367.1 acetate kinase [Gammaproteobacteria bacterium]
MHKVLVINSGSSSIKYQLFRCDDWIALAAGAVTRIGERAAEVKSEWLDAHGERHLSLVQAPIETHAEGIDRIILALAGQFAREHDAARHAEDMDRMILALEDTRELAAAAELVAIGHRVVHGGDRFKHPTLVDDTVIEAIRAVTPLAPLHNPAHLVGIEEIRRIFPNVPSVAVFDTAFHQSMPRHAYRYAIPETLYRAHRIRRYGFHGTSHQYVARQAAALLGKPLDQCNLITLHLGNGASATAIRGGLSIDTSMGLTPLEGLVMGTRSGDIDPAVLFYLANNAGFDIAALDDLLNRQSGLLGLCGVNDMREIQRLATDGDARAELAIEITAYRIKKYIGAYTAALGRVDAIVFTGGIGENDLRLRELVCADLEALGIRLDDAANRAAAARGERAISSADSPVKVLVIPTNEELEIARQALAAATGTARD